MCVPGSKVWHRRATWFRIACAFIVASLAFYQYVMHAAVCQVRILVETDTDFLLESSPAKLYYSEWAQEEVQGAQEYVAALAAHDMPVGATFTLQVLWIFRRRAHLCHYRAFATTMHFSHRRKIIFMRKYNRYRWHGRHQ